MHRDPLSILNKNCLADVIEGGIMVEAMDVGEDSEGNSEGSSGLHVL